MGIKETVCLLYLCVLVILCVNIMLAETPLIELVLIQHLQLPRCVQPPRLLVAWLHLFPTQLQFALNDDMIHSRLGETPVGGTPLP